ncbi:MAG: folylpolyglutamate synthase/dihydrofolate synthase family protein [Kiritimatiellia bacterium]
MHPVLKELTERRRFGMKPGLEKTGLLLESLGNPHLAVAAIHIAGTNGKGSVAAVCEAVLRAAGYPVGRYTSPHLNSVNERFLINGSPVSDECLVAGAEQVCAAIRKIEEANDLRISFFEAMTALAFLLFRDAGIKLVVLETGLGGRFDATNVVEPVVSVITRVGLDHCEWLGNTPAEIAFEKGGIIKSGRPVVVAKNSSDVVSVLSARAGDLGAPCISAEERVSLARISGDLSAQTVKISTDTRDLPKITTPLAACFHLENIAAAVCALEVVHDLGIRIDDCAFAEGLSTVSWPGRFHRVSENPLVILDGAHNPDAAAALSLSLRRNGIKDHVFLVAGFCSEKNVVDFLKKLQVIVKKGFAVEIDNVRSLSKEQCAGLMHSAGLRDVEALKSVEAAVRSAELCAVKEGGAVLVTGSLFLVAEVLELFQGPGGQDRGMNEGFLSRKTHSVRDGKSCI